MPRHYVATVVDFLHDETLRYQPDYPGQFRDAEHGRSRLGEWFDWYVRGHHHSGIAYDTPEQVVTGTYREVEWVRQHALNEAYAAHPERFVKGPPLAPQPPELVMINAVPEGRDDGCDIVNFPTLPKVKEMLTVH